MKLNSFHKLSEWSICQWEGELEDGRMLYAKVKHDRLSVGIGDTYAKAMYAAVSHPCIDLFLKRDDWEAPYPTDELLRHLSRVVNVRNLDADAIESAYQDQSLS